MFATAGQLQCKRITQFAMQLSVRTGLREASGLSAVGKQAHSRPGRNWRPRQLGDATHAQLLQRRGLGICNEYSIKTRAALDVPSGTAGAAESGSRLQVDTAQLESELLACCSARARRWCASEGNSLPTLATACYGIRGHPDWRMAVSSHPFQAKDGGDPHVIVSVALHSPGIKASSVKTGSMQVSDVLMHWGCVSAHRSKWRPPAPGWHTSPPVSFDAGGGAWQTPFELQEISADSGTVLQSPLHVLVLQLPLHDMLARGGLSFVLKTGNGKWLQDASSNSDFYFATAASRPSSAATGGKTKAPEPATLKSHDSLRSKSAASARPAPKSGQVQDVQNAQPKQAWKAVSQEDRNRAELPDITKGVPWSPGEKPRGSDTHVADILPAEARTATPWYAESIFGPVDEAAIKAAVDAVRLAPVECRIEQLVAEAAGAAAPAGGQELSATVNGNGNGSHGDAGQVSRWMAEEIAGQEHQAERSLMHRYSTAQQLVEKAASSEDTQQALTGVLVWLRLSAARHLTWNRNYNVKPREISSAQDALNTSLAKLFDSQPRLRPVALACMAAAGRGGSSDVGQRIRDEILAVQQRNGCKGGMMEEWHQKLHNNTSPDDVVICQALIAMLEEGLDVRAYWRVLQASGVTAQRLASFDRPIRNEPRFQPQQVPGLLADLRSYLQTLQAVHSGADLGSAAGSVLGFESKSMKGKLVAVEPVQGVACPQLREQLLSVLYQQQQLGREAAKAGGAEAVAAATLMLQLVLTARYTLRPFLHKGNAGTGGRLRDVLFLDLALDSTARTALETVMGYVKAQAIAHRTSPQLGGTLNGAAASSISDVSGAGAPPGLLAALQVVSLAVENAAISSDLTAQKDLLDDLCKALKWLNGLGKQARVLERRDWALQVVSVVDRLKRCLSDHGAETVAWLQPTALVLGEHLKISKATSCLMCEDAARGTALAPVSQLLAAIEPSVRRLGGQGDWQVISRGDASGMKGLLRYEASLASVQYETCTQPTVLLVDHVSGHEEVPEGVVALLTSGDCPDVLSHSAVRARNMGVLMAACLSTEAFTALKGLADAEVIVTLTGSEVKVQKLG